MDERFRIRIQSDLLDARRNISRYRNKDFSQGSGQRRLAAAIKRIDNRIKNLQQSWSDSDESVIYRGDMGVTEQKEGND